MHRLEHMNPRAPVKPVHFGEAPIDEILDIRGFNLNAMLEIEPEFLEHDHHHHDDAVQSFVFRADQPFDGGSSRTSWRRWSRSTATTCCATRACSR